MFENVLHVVQVEGLHVVELVENGVAQLLVVLDVGVHDLVDVYEAVEVLGNGVSLQGLVVLAFHSLVLAVLFLLLGVLLFLLDEHEFVVVEVYFEVLVLLDVEEHVGMGVEVVLVETLLGFVETLGVLLELLDAVQFVAGHPALLAEHQGVALPSLAELLDVLVVVDLGVFVEQVVVLDLLGNVDGDHLQVLLEDAVVVAVELDVELLLHLGLELLLGVDLLLDDLFDLVEPLERHVGLALASLQNL